MPKPPESALTLRSMSPVASSPSRGLHAGITHFLWPGVTAQAYRAWQDEEEATEYGASGIAILLANRILGYAVMSRSRKGTGFDYWLGRDTARPPFQDEARLEVSGIRRGDATDVRKRVAEKRRQVASAPSSLPGFVIVVEFSEPLAKVVDA